MPKPNRASSRWRFRELALPHLDDVYTLARYLLRDAADADDAVQECYLRALKHFHTYRGPTIKPWLAWDRHTQVANYLYLDGHAVTLAWDAAVVDMYPDKVVLASDGSYP